MPPDLPPWAKWLLGLVAAAFFAFQTFVGASVISQGERLARIEEQLIARMDDRYRRRDAEADFRLRDQRITEIGGRVDRLEQFHDRPRNGRRAAGD